jgi:hypothetical protein
MSNEIEIRAFFEQWFKDNENRVRIRNTDEVDLNPPNKKRIVIKRDMMTQMAKSKRL